MAKKFEIVGQSLVITDDSIPKVLFDFPKGEVYYDSALLINEGIIKINNIDALDNAVVSVSRISLTDAVDGTGTPFTESTFISFARTNLGFKTASGGSGAALTANPLSQFAATTSAQLAGVISDETGSGALVFATSPTLVTPSLGVATATSISGVALTTGGSATTYLNGAGSYTTPAGAVSDTVYGAGWNGDTTNGASKNAIYDKIELIDADITALEEGLLTDASTITTSRNHVLTDADGINNSTASSDVTITIDTNANVAHAVGTLLQYKRSGAGNVIIAYTGGVTGTAGVQTYNLNDVITLRKTATDTWEALNPPQPQYETIEIATSDLVTAVTTGTSVGFHRMSFAMKITEVRLVLLDAGTSTGMTVDINKNGSTILSTKLTTDATEATSTTATTPYVLTSTTLADGDILLIDHDAVPTNGLGSAVQIIGHRL